MCADFRANFVADKAKIRRHTWCLARIFNAVCSKICRKDAGRCLCTQALRRYRTKIVRQMRRQIFCQMKQKAEWILAVFTSIFVKYDGKFASRWRAKSLDALCAVLPLLFRCVPTGAAKMKKEKFSYDYSCCNALIFWNGNQFSKICWFKLCQIMKFDKCGSPERGAGSA